MHFDLYEKASTFMKNHIHTVDSKEEFYAFFNDPSKKGFIKGFWSEEPWIEEQIKKDLNVTIRCIPLADNHNEGICVISGKRAKKQVIYAKAY
jgi:prolyl-tRNA synthetase